MQLPKLSSLSEKLTQLPRRPLVIGGGIAAALAAVAALGIAQADERTTSRLAGLEVTQDATSYVITIPDAQQSRAQWDGRRLQVYTRDNATGLQSEQNIALPEADRASRPQVTKQDGNLVVTVAKRDPNAVAAKADLAAASDEDEFFTSALGGSGQDVFAQMAQMQKQMSAMMGRAFADMPAMDAMQGMPAMPGRGAIAPNAGLDLQDKDGNYIVRARNLDPAKQNIKVAVDNERVLKITAQHEDKAANRQAMSQVTKVFTLPGPVKSDEMKVDQEEGELVITLPKA